jgi:hypothetical protein
MDVPQILHMIAARDAEFIHEHEIEKKNPPKNRAKSLLFASFSKVFEIFFYVWLMSVGLNLLLDYHNYQDMIQYVQSTFGHISAPAGVIHLSSIVLPYFLSYIAYEIFIIKRYGLAYKEKKSILRGDPYKFINKARIQLGTMKYGKNSNEKISFAEVKSILAEIILSSYTLEEIEDKMISLELMPFRMKTKGGKKTFLQLIADIWHIVSYDVPLPEGMKLSKNEFPSYKITIDGIDICFYGIAHGTGRDIMIADQVYELTKKLKKDGKFIYSEENIPDAYGYQDQIVVKVDANEEFIRLFLIEYVETLQTLKNSKVSMEIDIKSNKEIEVKISGANSEKAKEKVEKTIESIKEKLSDQAISVADIGDISLQSETAGMEINDHDIIDKRDIKPFIRDNLGEIIDLINFLMQYLFLPVFAYFKLGSKVMQMIECYTLLRQKTVADLNNLWMTSFMGNLPEPLTFTSKKYVSPKKSYNSITVKRSFYMMDLLLKDAKKRQLKEAYWIGGLGHQAQMIWAAQHPEFIQQYKENENVYPYRATDKENFIAGIRNILRHSASEPAEAIIVNTINPHLRSL